MIATLSNQRPRALLLVVTLALLVFGALTLFVDKQVLRELEALKSARTDRTEWAMSQSEVEYLRFARALAISHETASAEELAEVRLRFDLFFSRVDLFEQGQLFVDFKSQGEVDQSLQTIMTALNRMIPAIDGGDDQLRQNLPEISQSATDLQPHVRELALKGVFYFSRESDLRREEISNTLTSLIYLTGALLIAMGGLSVALVYINLLKSRQGTQMADLNSRLQGILETSLDGVIVTNKRGEVLTLNPAAEQIFGYDANDVLGLPIGDLIVPDHLRQAHREGLARMIAKGERRVIGQGRVQLEAQRSDATLFPVELALSAVSEGDEEVFVAFLRDISQAKKDQQELIEARDHALAGEKAKTDFLTVMSHEIRTPLNGILGTLQLLFREPQNARQLKMLRNMDLSGQLLLRHVNAVLDIASTEAGKSPPREAPLNPGALVQNIVDGQSGAASARGNVIEWSWIGTPQPWVLSDENKLEQILLNLVGNAIKFTAEGRISVTVAMQPDQTGKEALTFCVEDTGIGIAPSQLDRVFDDFQTFDASLDRSSTGTGLGLGIARRFADAMGGTIHVESTPDVGSRFTVTLPGKRCAPPLSGTSEDTAETSPTEALNILVVDDNQINLDVMAAMLEHEGHAPICVTNGQDAVDAATARVFDIILMDISMPGMDGIAATKLIRSGTGPCAKTPIYAVSANVLKEHTKTYLESGFSGVLAKPLTFEALQTVLADSAVPPLQIPEPIAGALDVAQLEQLRKTLPEVALTKLCARFLSDGDALVTQIADTTHPIPDQELPTRCHNLAGSAAMFGATAFRSLLNQIEDAGNAGDVSSLQSLLADLPHCWKSTRSAIEGWQSTSAHQSKAD